MDRERETAENLKRFLQEQAERIGKNSFDKKVGQIERKDISLDDIENSENFDENAENTHTEDLSFIEPKKKIENFRMPPTKFFSRNDSFEEKKNSNPLQKYFRKPGISIKLPTMGIFYEPDMVDFSINGEVQIFPLTARDEIWLRNPDALLNGKALEEVFKSCCPSIKDLRKIAVNDVNAILVAIRNCSYGSQMKMTSTCPHCGAMNNFVIDLDIILSNMTFFEDIPCAQIDSLTLIFEPITYENMVYFELLMFEEAKVLQVLNSEKMNDEEKKKIIQETVTKIADMNIYLLTQGIKEIITPEKERVFDKNFIYEFLVNCPTSTFRKVQKEFENILQIGVPTKWEATCNKCDKKYDVEVQYDPANFFDTKS